jgi:hypothetical protein
MLQEFGFLDHKPSVARSGAKRLYTFQAFNLADVVLLDQLIKTALEAAVGVEGGKKCGGGQRHKGSALKAFDAFFYRTLVKQTFAPCGEAARQHHAFRNVVALSDAVDAHGAFGYEV